MFTIVATEIAQLNRAELVVYTPQRYEADSFTVFSTWAEDWNSALRARGYDVRNAWVSGAPQWAPLPGGLDDHEWTTQEAGRI